ncbi:tRNA pseudouridine(55) synthase TruB [candidate division WOR-3 bacterium]|uniref:tRNA pseudouridine synthase B n=1 Tax=candidate division WOR-3 bacterium TaxID=2052148 RepID=A0A937XGP2_UNCW3|nr:tRNA pseudouridine(55) synthase TruB [candidate division WOR-3 bacterium]
MRGVLNANKPSGISSYDVIRHIKSILRSPVPIGHAGTLDPLASGVLLILLGEATKVSRFLLNLPKEYVAGVLFGKQTDTDDITGATLSERPVSDLTADSVRTGLERFTGEIEQVPPAFSALKQDGEPLYRLARKGQVVCPKPRKIVISKLELLDWQPPTATIRCVVSAGTYVRALARDLGKSLGTVATLASLVRTRVGPFSIEDATTPDSLDATSLIERLAPIDVALSWMPRLAVSPIQARQLHQGKVVSELGGPTPSGVDGFALAETEDLRFLAVVALLGGRMRTERIVYAD